MTTAQTGYAPADGTTPQRPDPAPTHEFRGRRARRPRRRVRRFLSRGASFAFMRLGYGLVSHLPLELGRRLAWLGGTIAYYGARKLRMTAISNLTRVFGAQRTPRQIRRMARDTFRHLAMTFTEWAILRRWPRERLLATFAEVGEAIRQMQRDARASGKGVVGVTGHFGNWELLSHFCGIFSPGFLSPVAKRSKYPPTQNFFHSLRTGAGVEMFYTDTSARTMMRALRTGRLVAFLPDQDVRTNRGVFVDFFDRPTHSSTFPVRLARKTGVKMLCCGLVREGKGFRFLYDGLFDVPQTGDDGADLKEGTQRWSQMLEAMIRMYPHQWLWTYHRWRSSPEKPRLQHGFGRSQKSSKSDVRES